MNISFKMLTKNMMKKRVKFAGCILFSIIKALFYGWIFAYEIKKIMAGIELGSGRLLQEGIWELIFAVIVTAFVNILYEKYKIRIINQTTVNIEDDFINQYNLYYCLNNDESKKLTAIQNTIPNLVSQSVDFIYGLVYLITVLAVSIIYGLTISVLVVLIGSLLSGVMVFVTKHLGQDVRECTKESEVATNEVYGRLWEYNDNLEVLPFLCEESTYRHLESAIDKENELKIRASRLTNMSRIFMRFSNIGTVLLGGIIGGLLIYYNQIASSDLMALLILLPLISDSLFQIPNKLNEFNSIRGMCGVLGDFFGKEDKHIVVQNKYAIGKIKKITFHEFSFIINEEKTIELDSLQLEPGKVYGIYGASGIGKTSFFKVLTKLFDNYTGEIVVNDQYELKEIGHQEWWQHILYLDQENTIIPGSLKDNICLNATGEVNVERLNKALEFACLSDFVKSREDVINSISMENISSGEKQQICLARLFYLSKSIILLDEATSALSPKKEQKIFDNLFNWVKERDCIVIFISHSSRIRDYCDKVIEIS